MRRHAPVGKMPSFAKRDAVTREQREIAADMLANPAKFSELQLTWARLMLEKHGPLEQRETKPEQPKPAKHLQSRLF